MQKFMIFLLLIISIIAITCSCLVFSSTQNEENIRFLNSYGWDVKNEPIEKVNIKIPDVFDDVYNNYNNLQKEAGLDLSLYKGKSAIRYTYEVTNYPKNIDSPVRANLITVDNIPVAGDIMTTPISGFMHSLLYPETP